MSRVPVIWLLLGGDRSVRNSAYRGEAAPSPVISLALQQALQSWDGFLDRLPIGIYACDRDGIVVGRQRYCGSYKTYRADGAPLPPSEASMAQVLRTGLPVRDREVVIERPDGSRATILANVAPCSTAPARSSAALIASRTSPSSSGARRRYASASNGTAACSRRCRPPSTPPMPAGASPSTTRQRSSSPAGCPPSAANGASRGACIGPTARPCRMRNAPWRWRSRNSGRCGAPRRWPSAPMARAFPSYPIRRRFTTAGAMVGAVNMLVDISERKHAELRQK